MWNVRVVCGRRLPLLHGLHRRQVPEKDMHIRGRALLFPDSGGSGLSLPAGDMLGGPKGSPAAYSDAFTSNGGCHRHTDDNAAAGE